MQDSVAICTENDTFLHLLCNTFPAVPVAHRVSKTEILFTLVVIVKHPMVFKSTAATALLLLVAIKFLSVALLQTLLGFPIAMAALSSAIHFCGRCECHPEIRVRKHSCAVVALFHPSSI